MLTLRQEQTRDYQIVFDLIQAAFKDEPLSDHSEGALVDRLRKADTFISELSIVAELDAQIVGHILLTPITIAAEAQQVPALALAPVSVLPAFQKRGIGGRLIEEAHRVAVTLGHQIVALIGHEHYYPRFGYQMAHTFNIAFPFEVPNENALVVELVPGALDDVSGMVVYPNAFFDPS
ncbi:MAG: N-acetyltransferase [Bacteroidota bacterium]